MTDFTIEIREMCASVEPNQVFSEGGYTQTGLYSERDWPTCTCAAYKFKKTGTTNFGGRIVANPCKHIKTILANACGWHESYSEEVQETPGVCPKCGGPTIKVRVAV